MQTATLYYNKQQSHKVYLWLSAFIVLVAALVVSINRQQNNIPTTGIIQHKEYDKPLVITKGGTYSGNWESQDSEIPAVEVQTSEPVIITNSNIRSAGYLIKSWGYDANITVRHTNGYGLTPTVWKNYIKSRRFLTVDGFRNVVVENCYLENTAGIYIGENYAGDGTPQHHFASFCLCQAQPVYYDEWYYGR